jgi:hypothetical protein
MNPPSWFVQYAWDPFYNVVYAMCPGNYVYKLELGSPNAVEKKQTRVLMLALTASPNPFTGATTLLFANPSHHAEMRLYAVDGRMALEMRNLASDRIRIDGERLPAGFYTAEVRTSERTLKTRLCLAR